MTPEERQKLRETLLAPKKVTTDSGTVEERSVDDIKKGIKLMEELDIAEDETGAKRPLLGRVGVYGRINL